MNQRPLVVLYPVAALAIAALIYVVNRRHAEVLDQIHSSRQQTEDKFSALLADQRLLIDDVREYLQPLRDLGSNTPR